MHNTYNTYFIYYVCAYINTYIAHLQPTITHHTPTKYRYGTHSSNIGLDSIENCNYQGERIMINKKKYYINNNIPTNTSVGVSIKEVMEGMYEAMLAVVGDVHSSTPLSPKVICIMIYFFF